MQILVVLLLTGQLTSAGVDLQANKRAYLTTLNCRDTSIMSDILDADPQYWQARWKRYSRVHTSTPKGYELWIMPREDRDNLVISARNFGIELECMPRIEPEPVNIKIQRRLDKKIHKIEAKLKYEQLDRLFKSISLSKKKNRVLIDSTGNSL